MPFKQFQMAAIFFWLLPAVSLIAGQPAPLTGSAYAQSVSSTAEDAVQLIRNYYRWINQKKYQGAFAIWEKQEDGMPPMARALKNSKAVSATRRQ